jgi:hypothetical protein
LREVRAWFQGAMDKAAELILAKHDLLAAAHIPLEYRTIWPSAATLHATRKGPEGACHCTAARTWDTEGLG